MVAFDGCGDGLLSNCGFEMLNAKRSHIKPLIYKCSRRLALCRPTEAISGLIWIVLFQDDLCVLVIVKGVIDAATTAAIRVTIAVYQLLD